MNEPVEIMGNYDYQHVAKCVKYIKLIEDKYSVDSNSDIEEKVTDYHAPKLKLITNGQHGMMFLLSLELMG